MITRRRQHRTGPSGAEAPDGGLPHTTLVIRGALPSHMFLHHTSTQQRRADAPSPTGRWCMPARFDSPEAWRATGIDGTGRLSLVSVRSHIHPAKLAIVAKMRELGRPVTTKELYAKLGRAWSLGAIEYHLRTLAKTRAVERVYKAELRFSLTESGTSRCTEKRCR